MIRIGIEPYKLAAERLIYDETSPSCLRWRNGKPAGCQDKDGYWLVRIGPRPGILLKGHRVVWFLHHDWVPDLIDHRDAVESNCKIGNLRPATESQNRFNSKKHRDGTSNAKGVFWDKRTKSWMVRCTKNYKTYWGGRFKNKDEAIVVANALREKLHSGFARHD